MGNEPLIGGWDWQAIAALLCVAGALVLLIRRAIRLAVRPDRAGCGGGTCSKCPSASPANGPTTRPLITLDLAPPPRSAAAPGRADRRLR